MKGGSHSYGLSTPASDLDWRGVYAHTDVADIIGIRSGLNDTQVKQNAVADEAYWEVRRFLNLLRQGNTQAVEILFSEEYESSSVEFDLIRQERVKLVSSEKLFTVLRGYMQSEYRLAIGERTGKLGGKRYEQLQKFGYSPKNMVQLFRLAWAGCIYFRKGYFPVDIRKENRGFAETLLNIKTHPEKWSKDQLTLDYKGWESDLEKEFNNRKVNTEFDENLANDLCLIIYAPVIAQLYKKRLLDKI